MTRSPFRAQVDAVLYAKLCALNCRWFDFNGCDFAAANTRRKDRQARARPLGDKTTRRALHGAHVRLACAQGCGRVAMYNATGLTYIFTLECNYNEGKYVNRVLPPHVQTASGAHAVHGGGPTRGPLVWKMGTVGCDAGSTM